MEKEMLGAVAASSAVIWVSALLLLRLSDLFGDNWRAGTVAGLMLCLSVWALYALAGGFQSLGIGGGVFLIQTTLATIFWLGGSVLWGFWRRRKPESRLNIVIRRGLEALACVIGIPSFVWIFYEACGGWVPLLQFLGVSSLGLLVLILLLGLMEKLLKKLSP